ncbi:MAG: DUF5661 family protein [Bacilli bacterium]
MFTISDAITVANKLGIVFDKFTIKDLIVGLNIELEHGYVNPVTNVTNDDLMMTAKIALAHLMEFPNYYNEEYGLPALEKELEKKLKEGLN